MRYVTSGESHGRSLSAIVTGVPAGIPIHPELIDADLQRRQRGYGRGGRQRIETDHATILSGVRFGETLGTPVSLAIANRDWDNWLDVMAVVGAKPDGIRVTAPRPGHADLSGILKIGSNDTRDILERASARETAARVAAGGIAKALLRALDVEISSFVVSIGHAALPDDFDPRHVDMALVEASDVRCPVPAVGDAMMAAIDAARADGESLGGVFVVRAEGLVPGLGTYAEASGRLDALLGGAVMSIPAIKGVEIGDGFAAARRSGSEAHDAIYYVDGAYCRTTNRAGGVEGGMTNGEQLLVRAAMKPIPTLMRPLASVDIDTLEPVDASRERSDVCAVPAAAVVAEAEVAFVLAQAYLSKFGSDALCDIRASVDHYLRRISR